MSATGSSRILKTGDILKPGDTIKIGADSEVDLLLEHVESTVGLSSGSILKLERLSYEDTRYGRITQTRLGLAAGELSGKVHKQLAGARFEVVTPKEVASVRGTNVGVVKPQHPSTLAGRLGTPRAGVLDPQANIPAH